jgi:DNA-binding MarR family transcriptional regulator
MPPISHHLHAISPEVERAMSDIFLIEDMGELELFRRLKAVKHLLSILTEAYCPKNTLSHARMSVLIWLLVKEKLGAESGLSPSELSKHLGVSRNTVSALLNGLEEQKYIERHLHLTDRRQFVIQITPTGRDLVHTNAPQLASFISDLFVDLSAEERDTLFTLLEKLYESMLNRAIALGLQTDTTFQTVVDPA